MCEESEREVAMLRRAKEALELEICFPPPPWPAGADGAADLRNEVNTLRAASVGKFIFI
jgi:hypothetical protein